MKSQAKRTESDKLIFQWDNKASRFSGIKRNDSPEYNKQYSLDEYFDFLAEIKPNKQELKYTKVFTRPFTLM
ncbi:MAG: hypothetical protein QME42_09730 [bacterium]|nr:hypothetical protein [bacterium]